VHPRLEPLRSPVARRTRRCVLRDRGVALLVAFTASALLIVLLVVVAAFVRSKPIRDAVPYPWAPHVGVASMVE
jgi:hypothetical protein